MRVDDSKAFGHPARYKVDPGLADAVNTTLLLSKPLLVTGKPGTGKSELAERIAYEFDLGAVLRFEAQSLSEAQDLFYHFDLIGQMAASRLPKPEMQSSHGADAREFITFGPLGKAIIRSDPEAYEDLLLIAFPQNQAPKRLPTRSVVLIDEIDKASRDFPNDLLNSIDRLEFRIREMNNRLVSGAERGSPVHPIVIITSNSERDLPQPFLRRCTFYNIPEPDENRLAEIIRARVFPELEDDFQDGDSKKLPPLYSSLLQFFLTVRNNENYGYNPGTSELIDWFTAAKRAGIEGNNISPDDLKTLRRVASAAIKHPDDRELALNGLNEFPGFRI